MTVEQIKKLYHAEPFRPFVIHLADGREVRVPHREFMMMVPSGRTIVVSTEDDAVDIIDLLLVTDIELKSGNNRSPRNGSRKRRKQ